MNAYAQAAAAASSKDPSEKAYGLCAAAGCCRPGSMTTSTQGTQHWYCSAHFGGRGEQSAGIPKRTDPSWLDASQPQEAEA